MADDQQSIEEQVARMVLEDTDALAKKVHEISGQPYRVPNLTPDQELWAHAYEDTTVDVEQLRAAGMPESEIADHRFPLRAKLRAQAGLTYREQQRYSDRMAERYLAAQAAGRQPKPPERGPQTLTGSPLVPPQSPAPPATELMEPAAVPDPTQPPPPGGLSNG